MTAFSPGVSTLDRLVELTREVDFAAFIFAQDDWTSKGLSPKTSGIYVRGDPYDMGIPDGVDAAARVDLLKRRLEQWHGTLNA